ncbi:MAG TPA: hypothetical protein VF519_13810 [Mycobacteriales bacterium]|jgi:hypothetical protein
MRTLLAATVAAVVATGAAPVLASPYDAVLPADAYVAGPIEDVINILNELLGPGKREWVLHDPTMAVGTYTVTQGPNSRIVNVGVGDSLLAVSAVKERAYPGRLTEFRLTLSLAGSGPAVVLDIDGDGDSDVVLERADAVRTAAAKVEVG